MLGHGLKLVGTSIATGPCLGVRGPPVPAPGAEDVEMGALLATAADCALPTVISVTSVGWFDIVACVTFSICFSDQNYSGT